MYVEYYSRVEVWFLNNPKGLITLLFYLLPIVSFFFFTKLVWFINSVWLAKIISKRPSNPQIFPISLSFHWSRSQTFNMVSEQLQSSFIFLTCLGREKLNWAVTYDRAEEKIDCNMRSWWNIKLERFWHEILKFIRNSLKKSNWDILKFIRLIV